jgi:hypothetical protein
LPIVLYFHVRDGFKLVAFLTGVRTFVEQAAPGMTVWETREHNGQAYVRVTPSPQAQSRNRSMNKLALCYLASGEALIFTLSEEVLKRAIDRERERRTEEGDATRTSNQSWLGENVGVRVDGAFVRVLQHIFGDNARRAMQSRCWGNLPILNEWRRRYPDLDPVELHGKFWQRRLVCPGGGEYRWNETWKTMQSTVYGHPGEPKLGPTLPRQWQDVRLANFGLTFEENGLRAILQLQYGQAK